MQLPAWLSLEAWEAWCEVRKQMKRVPFTERVQKMWLDDLEEWHKQGYDTDYILREAAKKGWRGLFVNDRTPRLARPETHREPSQKLLGIVQGLKEHYAKKAAEKGRVA